MIPLIEIKNVCKSYNTLTILDNISFSVQPGEFLTLLGPSGCGKTTLLRMISGFEQPSSGEIYINGLCVNHLPPQKRNVHTVFQSYALFPHLSVFENVAFALEVAGATNAEITDKVPKIIEIVGLTSRIKAMSEELSGGEKQRVSIARALVHKPRLLIADEPTRGVDVGARAEIYRLLRSYAEAGHVVIVLSTDAIELAGLCDRVLVFSRGSVVRQLNGDELSEREITGAAITADEARKAQSETKKNRFAKLSRLMRGDYFPSSVLAGIIILLALVTAQKNSFFLGSRSVSGTLLLASILILVSCGQLTVLLAGSIDLSVGPLIGLTVVLMSFFATNNHGTTGLIEGLAIALVAGIAVGVINALGIRLVKLPAVIATLVMYIFLQGLALVLRPTPNGYIDSSTTKLIQTKVGVFPVVMIFAVILALVLERLLRRSRMGVELRAVGSSEVRAVRLGARINATIIWAHILCSLLAVLAGLVLSSLVGVGQAGLGSQYTLTTITAVVLGGASIFGGRGSYLGALLGAFLIQEIISATSFLGLAIAWQDWLPGLLILAGAALFSRARNRQ